MTTCSPVITAAYHNHADELRRYIQAKLGCSHTAEDLVQEAYIRLYRMGDMGHVEDLKSYLFRIAHNLIIDHYRSSRRKETSQDIHGLDDETDIRAPEPNAEDLLLVRDELQYLWRSMGRMSALCQRIFWLSKAYGFRNYEIAAMLGVCVSTVEKNIGKATRFCEAQALPLRAH